MSRTPMWRRYLRLFGPNPRADVDLEIEHHLDELVRHLVARGMSPDEARREAAQRFGSVARVRAECLSVDERSINEQRRRDLKDALWNDVLDAGRGLTRTPAFTVGAALILALGIGLNTTTYSFNKALLFPTVPIGDSTRVVRLWAQNMGRGVFINPLSEGEIAALAGGTRSFDAIASFAVRPMTLTGTDEAERLLTLRATTNLFSLLQVSPALGRMFTPQDAAREDAVAILSYRAWRNRFANDPDVLGRTMVLDGRPHAIVGVMPEPFWFESRDIDVWLPLASPRADGVWDARTLMAVARLKDDVRSGAAQSDVQIVAKRSSQGHPQSNTGWDVLLTGLLPLAPGETTFFAFFTTLTALLLTAACAHIANLMLARGMERRSEIAIRAALGASRWRIARQLFVESLALSSVGGALSLAVAVPLVSMIRSVLGPATPFLSELSLDSSALIVTGAFSLLASVLFGVAPALRLSAVTATDAMKQPAGGRLAPRRRPLVSLLIGFEVMVATLALIVTILLVRTWNEVLRVPFGFTPEGVLTFRIQVPEYKYPNQDDAARVLSRIRERLEGLPSIAAAGAGVRLPLYAGPGLPTDAITIEDRQSISSDKSPWAITSIVTPGYFEALGISLVDGRSFEPRDDANGAPVAVVSRSLATAYWPNQEAVGRRLKLADASRPWLTVIGVVGDVRTADPSSPQVRQLYLPLAQSPLRALSYFVRTNDDPTSRLQDVRAAVREMESELPVLELRTLTAAIDDTLKGQRFGQNAIRVNALIAVLLALTGVYSVVAFASARRRREIAIRVALGGRRSTIVAMLLRQALRPAFAGVAVGLVLAAFVSKAITIMIFGVNPLDPVIYGSAAALLCVAVALASSFPAIRATRIDAAAALRSE